MELFSRVKAGDEVKMERETPARVLDVQYQKAFVEFTTRKGETQQIWVDKSSLKKNK